MKKKKPLKSKPRPQSKKKRKQQKKRQPTRVVKQSYSQARTVTGNKAAKARPVKLRARFSHLKNDGTPDKRFKEAGKYRNDGRLKARYRKQPTVERPRINRAAPKKRRKQKPVKLLPFFLQVRDHSLINLVTGFLKQNPNLIIEYSGQSVEIDLFKMIVITEQLQADYYKKIREAKAKGVKLSPELLYWIDIVPDEKKVVMQWGKTVTTGFKMDLGFYFFDNF